MPFARISAMFLACWLKACRFFAARAWYLSISSLPVAIIFLTTESTMLRAQVPGLTNAPILYTDTNLRQPSSFALDQ